MMANYNTIIAVIQLIMMITKIQFVSNKLFMSSTNLLYPDISLPGYLQQKAQTIIIHSDP